MEKAGKVLCAVLGWLTVAAGVGFVVLGVRCWLMVAHRGL